MPASNVPTALYFGPPVAILTEPAFIPPPVSAHGSAFLCADLNITPEIREDHAAYTGNWLAVLKGDKRAIFTAAAHAQRAVDFLHAVSGKGEQTDTENRRAA